MANLLERIKEIVELEGYTITELERTIGASKGTLSRALNSGSDIQAKWLVAIADKFPDWSAEWLLRGRGEALLTDKANTSITVVGGSQIGDNINTAHDSATAALIAQLAEKDRQIEKLLNLLSK